MKEGEIENSLIEVIGSSGGTDLLQEAGEFALDQILEDGIVKDFPVLGTVTKLFKAVLGVQGYIFAKKLKRFYTSLSAIPLSERDSFRNRIESDTKFRNRVGENLLLLIDKLDDMAKPELLARAFSGFVKEEYDFTTFQRLAVAIDRCIFSDLEILRGVSNRAKLDPHVAQMFSAAGLMEIEVIPQVRAPGVENLYQITDFGRLFVRIVIDGSKQVQENDSSA